MKKDLFFLSVLCLFLATGCTNKKERGEKAPDGMVYICTGRYAKAYHFYRHCQGIKNCSGEIEMASEEEAIEEGRHLCRYCK